MKIIVGIIEQIDVKVEMYYEGQLPQDLAYLNPVFKGEKDQIFTQFSPHQSGCKLLVGLGNKEELTLETVRNNVAKIIKKVRELKLTKVQLNLKNFNELKEIEVLQAVVQGAGLGDYRFEKYKSNKEVVEEIIVGIEGVKDEQSAYEVIEKANHEVEGICLARDLINEPSNVLYPDKLAQIVKEVGEQVGLEVEILEENQLEELGMEGILTVGKGSVNPPRLIVMRHMKGHDEKVWGLVGKGLTCDTGGYSLKTTPSMYYQKTDMSGAANVLGLMTILANNHVEKNVIAVIPTCENVISGGSYKIGDVLTTMAGKTVEVLNTDAEGRLALADALYYIATKEKVDCIIDLATLTGAAGATFGNVYTATVSNNDDFYEVFQKAAHQAEEKYWRLPNDKAYRKIIDSDVADIKNTGEAGTITAALFLQEFVEEKPWIHLDIAATSCTNPARTDYEYKGGTGVAIRTLYELIKGE